MPVSSNEAIDHDLLICRPKGGYTIYVCTEAIPNFSSNFLKNITWPFVLVTGDSDITIDESFLKSPSVINVLLNKNLIFWYAQNLSIMHPKMGHLPIGLDYHTMNEKPGMWGLRSIVPIVQEHMLLTTLANSPGPDRRHLLCYCNWNFSTNRGDRVKCLKLLDKSVCYFEETRIPRQSTWARQAEFKFVISPGGGGIDCHRTWEALVLGCIPIVKRNLLENIFIKLPVLVVDSWDQINANVLLDYLQSIKQKKFNFNLLFREYWVQRLNGNSKNIIPDMTFDEFRLMLTQQTF